MSDLLLATSYITLIGQLTWGGDLVVGHDAWDSDVVDLGEVVLSLVLNVLVS